MPDLLIVDDEPHIGRALCALLAQDGIDARYVATGNEAIEAVEHESVRLVLLDLMMPAVDGIEVLKKMRACGVLDRTSVVMFSASDEARHVAAAFQAGAQDYWVKRFTNVNDLKKRIRAYLPSRSA